MPNLFKMLLPLTTAVDTLLAPEKDAEELTDNKQRFYFGGIHCTVCPLQVEALANV